MTKNLLLVHGAWHSGSGFKSLQSELTKLGINSNTVELSSVAAAGAPIGDMYADSEIVRKAAEEFSEGCVVLGHSYGGLPITQGLVNSTNVSGLIYLCAFMLDAGETLYAACGSQDPDWWVRKPGGDRLSAARPEEIFYNQCEAQTAKEAAASLRDQSLLAFNQPVTEVAWKKIRSTYIICENDQAIPLFAQEAMSKRANKVVRMSSDHSPFLSAPSELAKIISELI